jgi:nucleoside-diphosphate-sugar epimerase
MNKILLTGSTGFLGKIIYNNLNINNNLYTLSRTNSNYNCNLINDVPIFNSNFDIVIHSAGLAHFIPKSQEEKNLFLNSNISITRNLLLGLEKIKIKKFVFVSSVAVYGLIEGNHINEDFGLNATEPYGKSKIICEDIISKWCKRNNIRLTILRLPLVVDRNPPGNLKNMINAIKNRYYFNINGGLAQKSMVMASDVSNVIIDAAEIGGIFNLTDTQHPSFKDLSKLISFQLKRKYTLNMPITLAIFVAFIGDILGNWFPLNSLKLKKITSTLTFDDTKAKIAFNWNPHKVIEHLKIN